MTTNEALKLGIDSADMICLMYLQDLTDEEMMHRPAPGANHVKWQVGHLIASENMMIDGILPNSMPTLPVGFADMYSKQTAGLDDPKEFHTKEELLKVYREQRAATLAALAKLSPEQFDKPTSIDYAPTVGSMFSLQGAHWMMHSGQWAITRRQLGRPPLM
ncbi:DinB family protein [Planctomicrobium piriforme]|uniref:DinB superfamily protein n=1 Tax=Planctomicrobium piriforme TaxID=1576369 RepID=A0A1I3QYA3_9PLAN|nr:DinB family protein [Planctomicrobium piriforme]SFJ38261.1 DinB superfamily protein [Planctomicrobium piriforme]